MAEQPTTYDTPQQMLAWAISGLCGAENVGMTISLHPRSDNVERAIVETLDANLGEGRTVESDDDGSEKIRWRDWNRRGGTITMHYHRVYA